MKRVAIAVLLALVALPGFSQSLAVLKAGPTGEIATVEEANEVRIVFSEPMVVLGRIPDPVEAPWFSIEPKVAGAFRWSGTTIFIFTPDEKFSPSTQFRVRVDSSVRSIDGKTLKGPVEFTFTTPTLRLLRTEWYRKNDHHDEQLVIGLRFNQKVADDFSDHYRLELKSHAFQPPSFSEEEKSRLHEIDPGSLAKFEAKVERVRKAASANRPVISSVTEEWDNERISKSDTLVVLETAPGVPTESWIQVNVAGTVRPASGNASPGIEQNYVLRLPRAHLIDGFRCRTGCDPERWNPIELRSPTWLEEIRKSVRVFDITDPADERELTVTEPEQDSGYHRPTTAVTFPELGLRQEPGHTYLVILSRDLRAANGEALGYTWAGIVEYWNARAYTSFGDGHGVWEAGGGSVVPFYSRNMKRVNQRLMQLNEETLVPTIEKLEKERFRIAPPVAAEERILPIRSNEIMSHGVDLARLLSTKGTGLVWAAIEEVETLPESIRWSRGDMASTVIQVTNLGISVKDSPVSTLVFVTGLDDGKPIEGAIVRIRTRTNEIAWQGETDRDGIAIAPDTPLRGEDWWDFQFIVTAEKDGDVAYVGSNWNEGIGPWDFGGWYNPDEAKPILRGTIISDRGVYKPGEEIHFKVILRSDRPDGMVAINRGSEVEAALFDSEGNEVDRRKITLNEWSSSEWTYTLSRDARLGSYSVNASVKGENGSVYGGFLVAAYKRPDFRVDATLTGEEDIAGSNLNGSVQARYLFGSPMDERPVRWTYSKTRVYQVPAEIRKAYAPEQFHFLGTAWWDSRPSSTTIRSDTATLDHDGRFSTNLDTELGAGVPYRYQFEGEVTDISRQTIAGRNGFVIHPAPWYIGYKPVPYFVDREKGIDTEVIAARLDGSLASEVEVTVNLKQVQWKSVNRSEGSGFYTWESVREEIDRGTWTVETADEPVPLHIDIEQGGYYLLSATASDGEGRSTSTFDSFYVLGSDYTAWQRFDHNRIELTPERTTYAPGETARIMIKSPWERATALLTTEREGVKTWKLFELTSTQETVSVPISEEEIPNVFVSVLLIQGRTKEALDDDPSDPGKPAFRLGYVELTVEDGTKRLDVDVTADRDEYRPATKATVEVSVKDRDGDPAPSEVTLWAVDYGVLSLTAYQVPDIVRSVWVPKVLLVLNEESRQRIISRRVVTPKGASEGGGGGVEDGPGQLRKDFRVLAFWLGSVPTDANGKARKTVTLPESLTTYRIMAVAGDRESRFGSGDSEIRINKPVLLAPAWPRFLALNDKAHFGAVVHSQLKLGGKATVTMRSLDPKVLEIPGSGKQVVEIDAGGSREVRFDAITRSIGEARIQMSVSLLGERDAFEDVIPVRILATPETVAAYGRTVDQAKETVELPAGVIPEIGGLDVELASTALVNLGEGARYLIEYPYGCAEQRASRTIALLFAADLGDAFRLPGIDPADLRSRVQESLVDLEDYQCGNGGFVYWKDGCPWSSAYLTSYILHVYQQAKALRYDVKADVLERAYDYLESELGIEPPLNESWYPSYTAWQAYAIKVLVEGGRNQDSNLNRLYGYLDRMPVFALSYLWDAMVAKGEMGARPAELKRRIENAILPEGGSAHVEELTDPYLLWFWNSNIRSTAIALRSLVANSDDETFVPSTVRWLLESRRKGRWGNTQENALAMEALVAYYRKYEAEPPSFTASASLGKEALVKSTFEGRSTAAVERSLPMAGLLDRGRTGDLIPLVFQKKGSGTLFYATRLRYASEELMLSGMDKGFRIDRWYTPRDASGPLEAKTTFKAGDLVRVNLRITIPKERRWVAVRDPIPAGFEPIETAFATTSGDLADEQRATDSGGSWFSWWQRGGFDHIERHDDHVQLFATRLAEGDHVYSYLVRATTAGTFRTAPTHAEEMYEPEVFGRTATTVIEVLK